MTNTVSSLVLAVDSTQVKRATGDLDRLGAAGRRAEASAGGLADAFSSLRGLLSGAVLAAATASVLRQADAYNNLNARLKLVTGSAEGFARAQQAIFAISQRTGTGLEQTSDLYGALARSTESLGVSQRDLLGVTQTINQALAVSGTSAQSAAAALVQLGQGFASGTLRGEELNSILEQAPRLARAIADGLGVQVGQLRKLGEEGRLTAAAVFQALQRAGGDIQREFDQLPATVGRATTQLGNSLQQLIGRIDEVTGTSKTIASWVQSASASFDTLAESIRRSGGVLSGFVGILRQDFIRARLQATQEALEEQLPAFERAQRILASQPDSIRSKQTIADYNKLREAAAQYRKELDAVLNVGLKGRPANEGGGRFVPQSPTAPAEDAPASDAERYLDSLRKQLQATQDLSVAETVLADIRAGRLKLGQGVSQAELLGVARQIDAVRAKQKAEEEAAQSQRELQDAGRRVFEQTRDEIERSQIEIGKLDQLVNAGAINWDTYGRAVTSAFKAVQQSLSADPELFSSLRKELPRLDKALEKTDDTAERLGMTFSSAFEDAIVSGRKLSDVLKALGQDLLRISVRKTVTEPLSNYLVDLLRGFGGAGGADVGVGTNNTGGSLPTRGGRAIGGPVSGGSRYQVLERGRPELLSAGGKNYLLTGSQGGQVTPVQPAAAGPVINLTVQGDATPQTVKLIETRVAMLLARDRKQRAFAGV